MDKAKINQLLNDATTLIAQALKLVNEPDAPPVVVDPQKPLAQIIADAPAGSTITLKGEYDQHGPIAIDKNLKIIAKGATVRYSDAEDKTDTGLFTLKPSVNSFNLSGLVIIGGKAMYAVRSENAKNITITDVKSLKASGNGAGIFIANGCENVTLEDCSTEYTTVYSFYCGGSETTLNNKNITLRRCVWGKTASHCMRTYGVDRMLIEDCAMFNPDSASGRQAIKVMNGRNITVRRTLFDGTTRFGRDVNDPESYKFENVLLEDCRFRGWTRVDSDGVTYRNSTIVCSEDNYCLHLYGKTILENVAATYPGGKFASNTHNIVSKKNCTFNGVAV